MRATTWSSSSCAISARTAYRPARPARSTTGAAWRSHSASIEQLSWDALPPDSAPEVAGESEIARGSAAHHRHRDPGPGRTCGRRPGRRPILTSTCTRLPRPAVATVAGNFRLTAADTSNEIHHIVLDFGATAFPGARGPVARHRPARPRRSRQAAPHPALFDREPAQRRASGLQQCRAHGEARHCRPRRQAGARRRLELSVRSQEGRQGQAWSGPTARAS